MNAAALPVGELLKRARGRVEPAEAELLLAAALQRPRSWLFAHDDHVPDGAALAVGFLYQKPISR